MPDIAISFVPWSTHVQVLSVVDDIVRLTALVESCFRVERRASSRFLGRNIVFGNTVRLTRTYIPQLSPKACCDRFKFINSNSNFTWAVGEYVPLVWGHPAHKHHDFPMHKGRDR